MRNIGLRHGGLLGGVALGVALSGCNSFDKPSSETNGSHLVIPLDDRPAVTAARSPVPISGGTLTVLADSSAAIVSDPDRDRITVVDLQTRTIRHTIELQPGDEPGRGVEDSEGFVHVALRGGGAVVTIDPFAAEPLHRRAVCKAPRGIAFDAAHGMLHIACAEGSLVSLPTNGSTPTRTLTLEPDLRDVVVRGDELWVTRFKTAEVLRVNNVGVVAKRMAIPQTVGTLSQPAKSDQFGNVQTSKEVTVGAGVAWRAMPIASGGAMVVHQQAVLDDIPIPEPTQQGSAYGGGGDGLGCNGIVKNVVSRLEPDGSVTSTPINSPPLPVDLAVSPNGGQWVAVAHAGVIDPEAQRPFMEFKDGQSGGGFAGPNPGFFGGSSVSVFQAQSLNGVAGSCAFPESFVPIAEPVTAVAFAPNGALLAQTREPPQLVLLPLGPGDTPVRIDLPGVATTDTGHELFHRDAGGGIACASCHPEGGEDGHTWHFVDTGARRTQALNVGLRDTAPFHWNGDLPNVGAVMSEVFVGRMGGIRQPAARLDTLSEWLFGMKRPPAIRDAADEAAQRGKTLFESASAGCTSCHSGEKLTNNQNAIVDNKTRAKLQVPSLVGVGYRSPFMHNGCAATLVARFDPACGGDAHGNTASLNSDQINDLVAYLETL